MSLYKYIIYVNGVLGLGGGGGKGLYKIKKTSKYLTKIDHFARLSFLSYINCIVLLYIAL